MTSLRIIIYFIVRDLCRHPNKLANPQLTFVTAVDIAANFCGADSGLLVRFVDESVITGVLHATQGFYSSSEVEEHGKKKKMTYNVGHSSEKEISRSSSI